MPSTTSQHLTDEEKAALLACVNRDGIEEVAHALGKCPATLSRWLAGMSGPYNRERERIVGAILKSAKGRKA